MIKLFYKLKVPFLMTCKLHFPDWQCHMGLHLPSVHFWRKKWGLGRNMQQKW